MKLWEENREVASFFDHFLNKILLFLKVRLKLKTRRLHSGLLQLLSGFFNHHPVSLISFPSHLNLSPPSSYPSSISSHLSSVIYLLPFYIGGSAATPSHLRRGPSVDIPSVRRSQLSHQPLHPHFIVQVGQRLVKRNIKTRIPLWRFNKQPESFGHSKAHSNRILFTVYHSKTYQKSTSKEPFGTRSWYHQDTLHNQVHQKNQEPVLGFLSIRMCLQQHISEPGSHFLHFPQRSWTLNPHSRSTFLIPFG
jgi:hypothetical protein